MNTSQIIYETACSLFDELWDLNPIRLLGIRTSKLTDVLEPTQISIFDYMNTMENTTSSVSPKSSSKKQADLELALDKIREKYGKNAIVRGNQLKK